MRVLDSSALLAYLFGETGEDRVRAALVDGNGHLSPVNWAEVMAKVDEETKARIPPAELEQILRETGILGQLLFLAEFDGQDARKVAELRRPTRSAGLSIGDRAALATGHRLGLPVMHAEQAWKTKLPPLDGISIELIR